MIHNTNLADVVIIDLKAFPDNRGFFREIYQENRYQEWGIDKKFVQFNHSRSSKNTLRGLHFQHQYPQGKLISVIRGAILDVAADINPQSATFGKWVAVELSDSNHRQFYIPPGYAHGFLALSDEVDLLYACTDYYHPEDAYTVNWRDPILKIDWPVTEAKLSESDKNAPFLSELKMA